MTVCSFAKLNYTLDVLSQRPDHFHNLASVMQCISLADVIVLTEADAPGIEITCTAPGIPADETNLAYRAAEAALRAAGRNTGLHIELNKQIPSQAGLGGGSSNAAYTLRGVNELLGLNLDMATMSAIAADLGSDVPFFLTGGTAAVRGRGESVTPLPDGPPLWFVIVKPDAAVPTAWAYRKLDENPDRISARATHAMEEDLASGDVERIVSRMINDFEQVVYEEHMAIALAHDDLLMARARNARLCGSGAAVFGVAYSFSEAQRIADLVHKRYANVFVARALGREESLRLRQGDEEKRP